MNKDIPKEHIVKLRHGGIEKEFVTYPGLLSLAHKKGLRRIDVSVVQLPDKENNFFAVVEAEAEFEHGTFSDVGDASPESVDPHLGPHILRMASTRAKARALRDALNIGIVAVEELKGEENNAVPSTPRQWDYIRGMERYKVDGEEVAKQFLKETGKNNIEKFTWDEADCLIKKMRILKNKEKDKK
ncbi:MAG: hypothetical protein KJ655_03920 [Candidatus Thermoplasmatota archaeon]|nr:hypothetical protein [Candidatus Thermoplasmatota archaeon]